MKYKTVQGLVGGYVKKCICQIKPILLLLLSFVTQSVLHDPSLCWLIFKISAALHCGVDYNSEEALMVLGNIILDHANTNRMILFTKNFRKISPSTPSWMVLSFQGLCN